MKLMDWVRALLLRAWALSGARAILEATGMEFFTGML